MIRGLVVWKRKPGESGVLLHEDTSLHAAVDVSVLLVQYPSPPLRMASMCVDSLVKLVLSDGVYVFVCHVPDHAAIQPRLRHASLAGSYALGPKFDSVVFKMGPRPGTSTA